MKKYLILLALLAFSAQIFSQELKCEVTVIAPQIGNVEASLFETMENTIQEFMNSRKWTNDNYDQEEKIECSIQLTINEAINNTSFSATLQVQSSRPVYNSDYKTQTFLANDNFLQFTFLPNSIIQFSADKHRDNLSSILAYYAYIILGVDYDSMEMKGGTPHYLKAQVIVSNAQNAPELGWTASQNQKNRYWLIENILSQTFNPLRECYYYYHRIGMDGLYSNLLTSREAIAESIYELEKIHKVRPSSYNMQLFFVAKSDEIVNLFKLSENTTEKQAIYLTLKKLDPGNIKKYETIMK